MQNKTPEAMAELFLKDGLLFFPKIYSDEWVAKAFDIGMSDFNQTYSKSPTTGVGKDAGSSQIVQRSKGRFDVKARFLETDLFQEPSGIEDQPWHPVLKKLLGDDLKPILQGMVVALPEAQEQSWHIDGDHLFPTSIPHLPPHCINVFIPLVDVTEANGPTEFCPGSHPLTNGIPKIYSPDPEHLSRTGYSGKPIKGTAPKGSAILFDYRVLHRGLPNLSAEPRPLMYISFAKHWFRDRTFTSGY